MKISTLNNFIKLLYNTLVPINSKLDKLIDLSFYAALESLECVTNSSGNNKKQDLRDAIKFFIESMAIQDKSIDNINKLSIIYFGLALCQCELKEFDLAIITLKKYSNLQLKIPAKNQIFILKETVSALTKQESFMLDSQRKSSDFAKRIQEIENQNICQKIFNKKESKLLKEQWKYFNSINKL